ncbi:MAG: TRAP transporter fused permease subunit [Rhodospirillales bacterium]|nr:TRAP transporter fused permease subunit [Rhodospirillales bacterium]
MGMDSIVRWSRVVADLLALGLAGFAIYVAGFGVFDEVWVRAGTTGLPILISILYFSSESLDVKRDDVRVGSVVLNAVFFAGFFLIYYLWITLMTEQMDFFVEFTTFDYAVGFMGVGLIFYLTLRHFGVPLFLVCLLSLLILFFGNLIPGTLNIPEVKWFLISEKLWYSTDGVFGRPVAVVGQIVLVFILFGAILEASGAGATLLKFAFAVTGRLRGGPAHAAIVGSASFGTMNGAAVANVVTTGVFTIPMIKRTGFQPKFAGAVEATASSGGQIMPPVMGAVAFLMADITGIPYLDIIVAAAIPALMYYFSLFTVVWLEARKMGLEPTPKSERVSLTGTDWIRSISFFVPLGVIVAVLLTGRTAQNAGFYGLITAFVLSLVLYPEFRSIRVILQALMRGGRTCATIMIVVAAIGFVVGMVNMSGLGIKFAAAILTISGDSLFLSLVVVAIGCLLLGMGVPVGAAYLIIVLIIGPAIGKLGLSLLLTHLFVIYYAVLSAITPPVAVAAFAAAPIAGSKPIETGVVAVRLAIAGFLIPFIFVYHPSVVLLEEGFSYVGLAWGVGAFIFSTAAIATSLGGFSRADIGIVQRTVRLIAGVTVLVPVPMVAATSAAVILGAFVVERMMGAMPVEQRADN